MFRRESSSSADTEQSEEKPALNPKENFPLLNAACAVVRALGREGRVCA